MMTKNIRNSVIGYVILAVIAWSTIIGGSLAWNILEEDEQVKEIALHTARANFNKDYAFRLWGTKHGGVYVPPTKETPPNPYLAHLKNRDVVTTDGKKLTLMNPAYMVRELMDDYTDLYGITGRIVGQVALNPDNIADEWESAAIDKFIAGEADEIIEYRMYKGEEHLSLIRPFYMENEGCVKCHGHLGFKLGDVRGAVGVSLPMAPYVEMAEESVTGMRISHLIIYLLGLIVIAFIGKRTYLNSLERKRASDNLRDLNFELEQKVEERTYELQASLEHLKKAQKQIIESEKMISLGSLVAGVAHEINTPIGVGVSAASLLETNSVNISKAYKLDDMSKSEFEEYLEDNIKLSATILRNLERSAKLIRSFKQVAVDQVSNESRKFFIKEYIDEVLLSLHPKYKHLINQIEVKCPRELSISTNPGSIAQIITNLIMNSLIHGFDEEEYQESAKIIITVKELVISGKSMIQIEYFDNGKGISKEYQDKIFEPFYTTKRSTGGSGLGLSIVYNLVTQQLGGEISCESELKKGTTFLITLASLEVKNES